MSVQREQHDEEARMRGLLPWINLGSIHMLKHKLIAIPNPCSSLTVPVSSRSLSHVRLLDDKGTEILTGYSVVTYTDDVASK